MPVLIATRTPRASRHLIRQLTRFASGMLAALQREDSELSVLLCDDSEIRELNTRYRKQAKATDVLAFATEPTRKRQGSSAPPRSPLLGDVVISLQTAERQTQQSRATLLQESSFLLAHGLLHLIGMDHDTRRKAAMMNRRTVALLQAVGLTPPMGAQALAPAPRAAKPRKHRPKVRSERPRKTARRVRKASAPR